jgi:protein involved in polysaccharide export with SLBB domain
LDRQLAQVRPDGMILLPMAGEMRASGPTLAQARRSQIVRRLGRLQSRRHEPVSGHL